MKNLTLLLVLFVALVHFVNAQNDYGNYNGGWMADSPEERRGFNVITGPMDDDSGESDSGLYPWRHHVDFEEMHPGEDQVAMESSDELVRVPRRRISTQPEQSDEHSQNIFPSQDDNDDLIIPDFAQMFAHGPQLGPLRDQLQIIRDGLQLASPEPWWKGSNVCIKREEDEETTGDDGNRNATEELEFHMQFSACEDMDTRYSCFNRLFGPHVIKTVKTDYECCHGYFLNKAKTTCTRGQYKNIANTIEDIGGKEFIQLAKSVGLDSKLERENLTVFVPNDEALAQYINSQQLESNSIQFLPEIEYARRRRSILNHRKNEAGGRNVRRHPHVGQAEEYPEGSQRQYEDSFSDLSHDDWKRNALDIQDQWQSKKMITYEHAENNVDLQQTLLSHMVEGKLSTDDFVDEKVLYSENKDSVIRLNTWKVGNEKVKTANCARLVSVNHPCTNGMVHIVDRLFKPVTQTISDVISSNPDLSMLNNFVTSSGMAPMLKDPEQHLTLFAPTNAAIDKLGQSLLLKLRRGDPCLKRILQHHIVPITFCSSIVYGEGEVRSIDHQILEIKRNADDKIFVNGSQIITRDIVTTNGVVHIIDAVLISPKDKPIAEALSNAGLTSFLTYLERAGLRRSIEEMTNVTVFAPTNEALSTLPQSLLDNTEKLREVLLYHVTSPELRVCQMSHQQELPTQLSGKSIQIQMHSTFPLGGDVQITAQCGRVLETNNVACNGIIHQVDRILLPPELNLLQTLKTQPDFTIFTRLLSEHENLITALKSSDEPLTIFAPTDSAFYALPKETFQNILEDKDQAALVLKRHIAKETICCAGISPNLWFVTKRVSTLGGGQVPIFRDTNGQVVFGSSKITTCDLTASNGVVHTVDTVLMNQSIGERSEQLGACLPETLEQFDIRTLFFRL